MHWNNNNNNNNNNRTRVKPVFFNKDDYFLLKAELIMQNYFYKNIKLISKDRKNGLPKNCD